MKFFSNKKALELTSKTIVMITLMVFILILMFPTLLNLGESGTGGTKSIVLQQDIFECEELGRCDFKNCNLDGVVCDDKEKAKWENLKDYAKECQNNLEVECDKLQEKVQDSLGSQKIEFVDCNTQDCSDAQKTIFKERTNLAKDISNKNYQIDTPINVYVELKKEDLDRFFDKSKHSELKIYSQVFIDSAKNNNINPYYLVSHFILETGWGESKIWKQKYNGFGIRAYDDSPYTSATKYNSANEGIEAGAKWISQNYLHGTDYRKSQSLDEMNKNYATDPNWKYKIASNMNKLDSIS